MANIVQDQSPQLETQKKVTVFNPVTNQNMVVPSDSPLVTRKDQPLQIVQDQNQPSSGDPTIAPPQEQEQPTFEPTLFAGTEVPSLQQAAADIRSAVQPGIKPVAESLLGARKAFAELSTQQIQSADRAAENKRQFLEQQEQQALEREQARKQEIEKGTEITLGKLEPARERSIQELETARVESQLENKRIIEETERQNQQRQERMELAFGILGRFGSSAAYKDLEESSRRGESVIRDLRQLGITRDTKFASDISAVEQDFADKVIQINFERDKAMRETYNSTQKELSDILENRLLTEEKREEAINKAMQGFTDRAAAIDKELAGIQLDANQFAVEQALKAQEDATNRAFAAQKETIRAQEAAQTFMQKERFKEVDTILEQANLENKIRETDSKIIKNEMDAVRNDALASSLIDQRKLDGIIKQAEEIRAQEFHPYKMAKLQAEIAKLRRPPSDGKTQGLNPEFKGINTEFSSQQGFIVDKNGNQYIDPDTKQPVPFTTSAAAEEQLKTGERSQEILNDIISEKANITSKFIEEGDIEGFANNVATRGGTFDTVIDGLKMSDKYFIVTDEKTGDISVQEDRWSLNPFSGFNERVEVAKINGTTGEIINK